MYKFENDDIVAISKVIGNSMTGSEITTMINSLGFKNFDNDRDYTSTKWVRIQESIINHINLNHNYNPMIETLEYASKPQKWIKNIEGWRKFRRDINEILLFHGLELQKSGKVSTADKPQNIDEAAERLNGLIDKLNLLSVHSDVIKFAKKELLKDNYFHAILESSKGIMSRLREISELNEDGNALVDKAFSLKKPIVLISGNFLSNPTEKSSYLGLAHLLRSIVSMYRNPKAHDPKLYDETSLQDAVDAFMLMSIAHRQLDKLINVRDIGTN
ncbi:TIGR02391 family protein [Leuconostoc pseudomesenteroides]|uniref:TIGR02391 family protein n=1 Tax=Leuconostoc pseudomesenteroides TaxID=33968 RepID=UPI00403D68A0